MDSFLTHFCFLPQYTQRSGWDAESASRKGADSSFGSQGSSGAGSRLPAGSVSGANPLHSHPEEADASDGAAGDADAGNGGGSSSSPPDHGAGMV